MKVAQALPRNRPERPPVRATHCRRATDHGYIGHRYDPGVIVHWPLDRQQMTRTAAHAEEDETTSAPSQEQQDASRARHFRRALR